MSITLDKGTPIALISNKINKKFDKRIIRLSLDDGTPELTLSKDSKVQVLPSCDIVERIYVSGPSGSGKSYWISKWIQTNRKIFKHNNKKDIYIFSRIKFDKQLDKFKPERPDLQDILEYPDDFSGENLENSIVIFDDIDSIRDKHIKEAVYNLQSDLLVCGRHFNITVLCTSHQIMNQNESKRCINESNSVVLFPKSGATMQIKNFLKLYCGFDKHIITKIMKLKSRWVTIRKVYPMCIIHENGAFLANMEE